MLKQKTVFEVIGERKTYRFECDPDSPLGEIHDVLCQMKHYVVNRINDVCESEKTSVPCEKKEVNCEFSD